MLALAGLTVVTIEALRAASERTVARDQRERATRAHREARSAGATRWAPDVLERTDALAQQASIIMQVEEARVLVLAHFAAAASAWSAVSSAAQDAAEQAIANKRNAQSRSEHAIARAQNATAQTLVISKSVHLGSNGQMIFAAVRPSDRRLLRLRIVLSSDDADSVYRSPPPDTKLLIVTNSRPSGRREDGLSARARAAALN